MTLLDHVVLQVDDLDAIGDWYDQVVSLPGVRAPSIRRP
jgi:catechol-2,3-dioxygenase